MRYQALDNRRTKNRHGFEVVTFTKQEDENDKHLMKTNDKIKR
jgi:hypothetical protein